MRKPKKISVTIKVVPVSGRTREISVELGGKNPTIATALTQAGVASERTDITVSRKPAKLADVVHAGATIRVAERPHSS